MAKYNSLIQLSGSIGQATFADNNGTPTARFKSGMSTHTWKTSKKLRAARNQSHAFGAASKLASLIHGPLDHDFRRLLGPHYHNRITSALLAGAPRLEFNRTPALPAVLNTAALRHLDLAHLPPEGTAPIMSTQHHTLSQKVTLHGLHKCIANLPLKKGEILEYRILTAQVKIPAATADPSNPGTFDLDLEEPYGLIATHKTDWDTSLNIPETTEIPAPHIDNTILIVAVEWRAIQGRRVRYFPKHNMIRVAAAHTGTRPKDLPWLRHENPQKRKPRPKAGPNRVPPAPITLTPKQAKEARTRHQQAFERITHRIPLPLL